MEQLAQDELTIPVHVKPVILEHISIIGIDALCQIGKNSVGLFRQASNKIVGLINARMVVSPVTIRKLPLETLIVNRGNGHIDNAFSTLQKALYYVVHVSFVFIETDL